MTRGLTYQQRRWPETPLFQDIAAQWCADQSRLLLDLVWRACDSLYELDLKQMPLDWSDEAKEVTLNHRLQTHLERCKTGDEPFGVSHKPPEVAHRNSRKGSSPEPDIGFVWFDKAISLVKVRAKSFTA